jgi:hypothetical protein
MRHTPRRLRSLITAWLVSVALTLLSVATVLADGTGGPFPR